MSPGLCKSMIIVVWTPEWVVDKASQQMRHDLWAFYIFTFYLKSASLSLAFPLLPVCLQHRGGGRNKCFNCITSVNI